MNTYYVLIGCTAGFTETPEECGPDIVNCGQVHFLRFESDNPQEYLVELRKKYTVKPCPVGKKSRYLATSALENFPINGHEVLTIDDLVPKGIDLRRFKIE